MSATLALLNRTLQSEARNWTTHLVRAAVALVVLLALWRSSTTGSLDAHESAGRQFFSSIIWWNAILLTLYGCYFFGSAITEEKEASTLPMLRMTDLSAASILLGKSSARMFSVLLLLALQIPFAMLAVTLGGVSTLQIYAAYAALLAHFVFLANLALLASTLSYTVRGAAMMTSSVLVLMLLLPGLWETYKLTHPGLSLEWADSLAEEILQQSVYTQLNGILQVGFDGEVVSKQVIGNLLLGLVLFLTSWVGFDRWTARIKAPAASGWRRMGVWLSKRFGKRPTSNPRDASGDRPARAGRQTEVWTFSPLAWKEFRANGGRTTFWMKTLGYSALFIGLPVAFELDFDQARGFVASIGGMIWLLEASLVADRLLANEIKQQTLPLLCMLPQGRASWCAGKVLGGLVALLPITVWWGGALLLGLGELRWEYMDAEDFVLGCTIVAMLATLFAAYLHLVSYLSLVTRFAIPIAVAIVWMGGGFWIFLIGMLTMGMGGGGVEVAIMICGAHAVGFVVICLVFQAMIGRRLEALQAK